MDSREFAKKVQQRVAEFCKGLDDSLPAYSYIPLTTDEMRIKGDAEPALQRSASRRGVRHLAQDHAAG